MKTKIARSAVFTLKIQKLKIYRLIVNCWPQSTKDPDSKTLYGSMYDLKLQYGSSL